MQKVMESSSYSVERALIAVLNKESPFFGGSGYPDTATANHAMLIPPTTEKQRSMLGNILISSNHEWDDTTLKLFDEIWGIEKHGRLQGGIFVRATDIPKVSSTNIKTELCVWKGDITHLKIGAITNAANDQGLGCFAPRHVCIDNIIHRIAGPRLRDACRKVMAQRGYPLSAGTKPILTPAFYLPSSYVIHVTGPQIPPRCSEVTDEDILKLKKAYEGSLMLCVEKNIRSIAFCCISTGVFGFPKDLACHTALTAVLDWLMENDHMTLMDTIVFDVFSDEEEKMYIDTLNKLLQNSKYQKSN